jgi:hypothetical protein
VEPDHVVGEVGVGPHAGRQCQWEVGEHTHGQGPYHGRHRGCHDQVALGARQALLVTRVGPDGALWSRRSRRVAQRGAVAHRARTAGVGQDGCVDGDDVGHGHERRGACAELLGKGTLADVQLEVSTHAAPRDGAVHGGLGLR